MISRNGIRLVSKSATLQSSSARGFFGIFYQWLKIGYTTSLRYNAHQFHTKLPRRPQPLLTRLSTTQIRHESKTSSSVRKVMRSLPHSVVVLTTANPEGQTKGTLRLSEKTSHGITLSSFHTATLSPYPIITFNIHRPSRSLSALKKCGSFLIHILHAVEPGAAIADHFTRPNAFEGVIIHRPGEKKGFGVTKKVVNVNGGEWQMPMPMLKSKAINWVLRCEVLTKGVLEAEKEGMLEVGDHTMVFARVQEIIDPYEEHKRRANKNEKNKNEENKSEEVMSEENKKEDKRKKKTDTLSYAFGMYRKMGPYLEFQKIETPAAKGKDKKKADVKDANEVITSDSASAEETKGAEEAKETEEVKEVDDIQVADEKKDKDESSWERYRGLKNSIARLF